MKNKSMRNMKKLLLIFSLLFLLIGLSACTMIGGNKVENNEMELTREQQDILALQIYNGNKGVESINFSSYFIPGLGATPRVVVELNGNPEDKSVVLIRIEELTPEYVTQRYVLDPIEWNEKTQTDWFRGRYEHHSEANTPRETDPSKIKITYLDGSTNQ